MSVNWKRSFMRGCGVKRWRPTLATPVSSRVGPPSRWLSHAPLAVGIERVDFQVLPGELDARLVHPLPREDVDLRGRERPVLAKLHGPAAAGDEAAERLDVLVGGVGEVASRLTKVLVGLHWWSSLPSTSVVRMSYGTLPSSTGKPFARSTAAACGSMLTKLLASTPCLLEGEEEERPVLPHRTAERGAPLLLAERRLLAVDAVAETSNFSKWSLAFSASSRK